MRLRERVPRIGDRVVRRPAAGRERSERLVGLAVPADPDRGDAALGLLLAVLISIFEKFSEIESRGGSAVAPPLW